MVFQQSLQCRTEPRQFLAITRQVASLVTASGVVTGLAHIFVQHTSCGLVLTENADPDVRHDLELLARRWAPDGDPGYRHTLEGDDDMAAHARAILSGSGLILPVGGGHLLLGTWQGIYLWEHRAEAHQRQLVVTVMGEPG